MVIQNQIPQGLAMKEKRMRERERGREGLDLNSNFVLAVEGD